MGPTVLDDIPFEIDIEALLEHLHVDRSSAQAEAIVRLANAAQTVGRPKALYRPVFIESRTDESIVADGITFRSRVLRVNVDHAHRIFPFVATCGRELDGWAAGFDDMLHRFWTDAICRMALHTAISAFSDHLDDHLVPGPTSTMSPGSLADWPTEEQANLFALLGDTKRLIGVELTDSCLMVPTKSVSGIRFPTDTRFENCQLCPRERCPGRRAPYENGLYEKKYRQEV